LWRLSTTIVNELFAKKTMFDLSTSSDLDLECPCVKVTHNLNDWSLNYVQPFRKHSQRFDQ